jgi:hypothetical protein
MLQVMSMAKNEQLREEFGRANRHIIQEKAEYDNEMAKVEKGYQALQQREKCPRSNLGAS